MEVGKLKNDMSEEKMPKMDEEKSEGKEQDLQKLLTEVLKQANDGETFVSSKRTEIAQNDRIYNGDHWYGVSSTNTAEKPSINVTRRISDFKISSLMVEQMTGTFKVKGIRMDSPKLQMYQDGAQLFTRLAKETEKRLDITALDEGVLKRSNIAGKGLLHYFWDDGIEDGNDVIEKGNFVAEKLHSINWYPSDKNNTLIEPQDWHIVAFRRSLAWGKKYAEACGRDKEEIKLMSSDKDTSQAGFDEAQQEGSDAENLWFYAKYWKKDGEVWGTVVTKGLVVKTPFKLGLTRYPIVGMDWMDLEESAYGQSEITTMKYNQFAINKMLANACVSVTKTAHPVMIYNKSLMTAPSGQPGKAFGVEGSVHDAFKFEAPGQMSFDIWRMLDSLIAWTKEQAGATETALGEVKAENTSALLANQAQASVPIATILRRFKKYKRDTYLLWCDFFQHKYDMGRLVMYEDDDGNEMSESYTGTDYEDIKFSVDLDVGAASQYSEVIVMNLLNKWMETERISFVEMLERIGDIIPNKQGLIDTRQEAEQEQPIQSQISREQLLAEMTPEQQAQWQQMTPEQQETVFVEAGV